MIISCRTIENELLRTMELTHCQYPVYWLESGLHNWPDTLNTRIQDILDHCSGYDSVLLAMSFCGNAVVGLRTHDFQLVIPRCDDCITLLLGSLQRRKTVTATYFLTEGWLRGERNIWVEYQHCLSKYGQKRGKIIFRTMLSNYKHMALLDTGCFDAETLETQVRQIAEALELSYVRLNGTLEYLNSLLGTYWDPKRFVVVQPNSIVTNQMCTLEGGLL